MRQRALIAASIVVTVTGAVAEPKTIDVSKQPLLVFKDDAGGYYTWVKLSSSPRDDWASVYYGDGKGMYRQKVTASARDESGYEYSIWTPLAPRTKLRDDDGHNGGPLKTTLYCDDAARVLTPLLPDDAKAFVDKTKFYDPLLASRAQYVGRTDTGVYYSADWTGDKGLKAWRLWVGKKGAMKQLVLTSADQDSAGTILSTSTATLAIANGAGTWITGDRKLALVTVPVDDNEALVYRDLGIYGRLGVVCEHH